MKRTKDLTSIVPDPMCMMISGVTIAPKNVNIKSVSS